MDSPAQSTDVFGNDNIIVQASGSGVNVTVEPGRPFLRLTQYERRTKLAVRDNLEASLLSAYRTDVVPLIGREREMSALRHWLDNPMPVSIRVLVGTGGRGKTRLALELARAISNKGWLAGFASEEELARFRAQNRVEQWRWDKPALVVIDYAASRSANLAAWVRELVDASVDGRPKFRLLLIERQANREIGWFVTVFGQGDDDNSRAAISMLDPPDPVELAALSESEFRREVFATLLRKANEAIDAPASTVDPQFDRLLTDRKWAGDPLYLMMAGLVAGKEGIRGALSLSRTDLALSMARHELDRIGQIAAARGIDERRTYPGAFVRHLAVMATLIQGLSLRETRLLARSELVAMDSTASLDTTIEALMDALPASEADCNVAPILPDIVGEGAIVAWMGPSGGLAASGVDPQPRIAAAAQIAFAKVSTVLVRAAHDFAAAGYAEPIRWLEALAGAPETDLGALMQIADALPDQSLALSDFSVALRRRIAHLLSDAAVTERAVGSGYQAQSEYVDSLNALGQALNDIGRREDALAAMQEAVEISHRLVADRSDANLPHLARSLGNLGAALHALGRLEDALAVAREADELLCNVSADQPDAYLHLLAT